MCTPAKLPGRIDIKSIITWEESQLKKLDVQIKYGMEVTPDNDIIEFVLSEEKPDAVIIATGSSPIRNGFQPYTFEEIVGWDQPNVCTEVDVLEHKIQIGKKIVIGDSLGFIEAPGLAEYLARQGKEVEIVTPHPSVGLELRIYNHWQHLMPRLFSPGVVLTPMKWIRRIRGDSVHLYNVYDSGKEIIRNAVDNIVLITGKKQNDSLLLGFKRKISQTYLVGDANFAGARIGNAIFEGHMIARQL